MENTNAAQSIFTVGTWQDSLVAIIISMSAPGSHGIMRISYDAGRKLYRTARECGLLACETCDTITTRACGQCFECDAKASVLVASDSEQSA